MKRAHRDLAIALFSIALLSGCATLEPPDITLIDLRLTDITVLETSGEVALRIVNPSPDTLRVDGAAFGLHLDGLKVGQVLVDEQVDIERLDSAVLAGTLHISNLAMATRLKSIFDSAEFDYRLAGKVWVLTDLGRRGVRVERSGHINLNEAAAANE